MATPKPGEIRCPTCHRSTAPAAFCTQCGSAIPQDARARPRGMDREELQGRIRARRSGGEPYRRGTSDGAAGGYERFEPDPNDAQVRRGRGSDDRRRDYLDEGATAVGGAAAGAAGSDAPPPRVEERRDLTREPDHWRTPAPSSAAPVPSAPHADDPAAPTADYVPDPRASRVDYVDDDAYDADAPYEYDDWEDERERRSGVGALAILGFLALGVLALLGGAVLAGVFNGDPGVGQASPSTSVAVSEEPEISIAPSVAPSVAASGVPGPSGSPAVSGAPVVFPDGFTAEAQPCIPGSVGSNGCNSSGAVNNGQVEIWVGFENGSPEDVVGVEIVGPAGNTVADVSIDLVRIQCQRPCTGYTFFNFTNLEAGQYQVRVTRNGEAASATSFVVS